MTTVVETDRWVRTDADRAAAANGCYFDEAAGQHAVDFFEKFLHHSKGQWAGKPFTLLPWEKDDVLAPLFGWKRADGTRRYRIGYIEVPKKNGKSTIAAGVALYLLMADGEPGAEVYGAASDRDQASIVYREAASMARSSPALAPRLEVIDSRKNIAHGKSGGFYRVLTADAFRAEGLNVHGLIFDELHAQRDRRLWDALRYGGAARRQPLLLSITTAGWDRNSICWEQREYAKKVLDGGIQDDSFFAYIRCAELDEDWSSPAVWRKANPSLGVITPESEMADACKEAQESPAKENGFKRYRLNMWTEQAERWLPMDKWDACNEPPVNAEALRGRTCYAGLDLSSTTDTTALALAFPDDDDGVTLLLYFWIPEVNAELRERRDRTQYRLWKSMGLIDLTPGNTVDYRHVRARINELSKMFSIQEIAFDPWNATQLAQQLKDEDGLPLVQFRQGTVSMNAPCKQFYKLLLDGKIRHGGNAVLRYMAGNVAAITDASENIRLDKSNSTGRIDGIVAAVMALGLASLAVAEPSYFRAGAQL